MGNTRNKYTTQAILNSVYNESTQTLSVSPSTPSGVVLLDQSSPQTMSGLSDGFLKLTSGVIGTSTASAAISIGTAITGSTAKSVLYVDNSNNLAQDNANFNYDPSTHVLALAGAASSLIQNTVGDITITPAGNVEISTGNLDLATGYHYKINGTNLSYSDVGALAPNGDGSSLTGVLHTVTTHNLLSATHGDTLSDNVIRGDIVYGNATPKWARLAFPATPTNKVLQATATDIAWSTNALSIGASASVSGSNTGDQTLSSLGAQAQLNGTGFVKASGTSISYDNSTYLTSLSGALLATGATVGATSGFQKFNTGIGILEGGSTPTKFSYFQGGDQTVDITYTLPTAVGAAGTVLTDAAGNGILSWAAGGGAGMAIGGSITSATAQSVLYAGAAGVLAQDNSNFNWDYTNKILTLAGAASSLISNVSGDLTITPNANLVATNGITVPTHKLLDATIYSSLNALTVQSKTTNARSIAAIIPNGSSVNSDFMLFATSDAVTNYSFFNIGNDSATGYWAITNKKGGSPNLLPMYIDATGNQARANANLILEIGGQVGVMGTIPVYGSLNLPASADSFIGASLFITPGTKATGTHIISGKIESTGTHLYWTDSGNVQRQLDQQSAASQTPWGSDINAAGYTLYGNSTSAGTLNLQGTSHATKGLVKLNANGGNVLVGVNTGAATATPVSLSLGGTYGNSTRGSAANIKLYVYNDGSSFYGLGVSAGFLEITAGGGAIYMNCSGLTTPNSTLDDGTGGAYFGSGITVSGSVNTAEVQNAGGNLVLTSTGTVDVNSPVGLNVNSWGINLNSYTDLHLYGAAIMFGGVDDLFFDAVTGIFYLSNTSVYWDRGGSPGNSLTPAAWGTVTMEDSSVYYVPLYQ